LRPEQVIQQRHSYVATTLIAGDYDKQTNKVLAGLIQLHDFVRGEALGVKIADFDCTQRTSYE
jgi:hypothetical protein